LKKELHVITTGRLDKEVVLSIASQIHPYIDWFHLREKDLSDSDLINFLLDLTEVGVPSAKVVLNGRSSVAQKGGATGVQLSFSGEDVVFVKQHFPMLRIGCSVHAIQEAIEKEEKGADFILYGHVFETSSKPGLAPRGLIELQKVADQLSIPVIAIGGIQPENVKEVLSVGASGIAVLSGIFEAYDPLKMAILYREQLDFFKEGKMG